MTRILPLLREFRLLESKRSEEGVTPDEYRRWHELKERLAYQIPQGKRPPGGERRQHVRIPSRIVVEFASSEDLKHAVIRNVSRGGLFISTSFVPEIGTQLVVLLSVGSEGEKVEIPCEVVSKNVGSDFTTQSLGMGVRFGALSDPQREAVDRLFCEALGNEASLRIGAD
jgi:Tfp pilus assembly protein PilZ